MELGWRVQSLSKTQNRVTTQFFHEVLISRIVLKMKICMWSYVVVCGLKKTLAKICEESREIFLQILRMTINVHVVIACPKI